MALYSFHALANGLHTDHPIPGLAFVDDSHIPVTSDDPGDIEKVGRHHGGQTWGRYDPARYGGWVAYTTDPDCTNLAWLVRWHPGHGRSVTLYSDEEAPGLHVEMRDRPLLWRAGGYWWDGDAWYRPGQVWDAAAEEYYQRPVPGAVTVTADGMLADGDTNRGRVLHVSDISPSGLYEGMWADDLALWARDRDPGTLSRSVVTLTAPELVPEQLIGAADMARTAGVTQSTLRSYIARAEADVPLPQAVIGGRSLWSRPVAAEWAEQRERSDEGLARSLSREPEQELAPGVAEDAVNLAKSFHRWLWNYPPFRRRWALRWRQKEAAEEVAAVLARDAAEYTIRGGIPVYALAATIQHAVLDEFAYGLELERGNRASGGLHVVSPDREASTARTPFGIRHDVAKMLDWLIRHHPSAAASAIRTITGEAERRFRIPRETTEWSISTALSLDGKLDGESLQGYLRRVMTPTEHTSDPRHWMLRDNEPEEH